ncbi:MAG: FAD-dependent oxidoreductase [Firmicutes bacterium]|nr:FAD-dependent oxidoreductase [Bacillota bacterium]
MAKILFSSWKNEIIDEREKDPAERLDLAELKLPAELEGAPLKAFLGWAGLVLIDPQVNIVEALRQYFKVVQQESCGRCVPCRVGTRVIYNHLEKLAGGKGTEVDLTVLERLGRMVKESSLCELGQSAPVPLLHALEHFRSDFEALLGSPERAADNGLIYRSLLTAPCRNGCPAHVDIPLYVGMISGGFYEESLAVIREKTPLVGVLGRVCVHPCEDNCRRQPLDDAVSIRVLKRFVADFEVKNSGIPLDAAVTAAPDAKKVAVIGAGPAGLNAAYQLARKGYRVTIYEALPVAGGMLAVGIPSYRLPRDILNGEINLVKSLGVEIKLNTRVGKDITFEELRRNGYAAVLIATGLHESSSMRVEGEDAGYKGFFPGVEYLRRVNLHQEMELGRRVAVIGGGNVAMDCARSSLRLGIEEVYLVYRRSRAEMPANVAEIVAAEEEGVIFHLLANPTRILAEEGRVVGMECIRMELGEPDSSGRRRPMPVKGSEFILDVDMIVPAIGQVADLGFLTDDSGVELTERGVIAADPLTMATTAPGVFAAGDTVLGARTVIEAIASANKAVEALDSYLSRGEVAVSQQLAMENFVEKTGVYNPAEKPPLIGNLPREHEACAPVAERIKGFTEAELGFDGPPVALREAGRCASCLRLGLAVI